MNPFGSINLKSKDTYVIFQYEIVVADQIEMQEMHSYCTDVLKKNGLYQQQREYPKIRDLSRGELEDCLRDSSQFRRLFPDDVILCGVDMLTPSVENCNEYYLFEGDRFYAVPDGSITALASCDFTPNPDFLIMRVSLHGSFTPEMIVGFLLHFLPKSIKYNIKNYRLTIAIVTLGDLNINLTKKKIRLLSFYKDNVVIPHEMGIMLKERVLKSNI